MNKDLLVDGRLLISAKNASKRFGYTPDYISQLARSGTIPGRLLGRTWYVDLEALKQHKLSKLGTQKPEKPTFEIQTPSTPAPAIHHEPLPPVSLPELTKKPIPSQWDLNPLVIRHTLVSFFSVLIIAGSALFWTNHFAPALSTKTLDTLSEVGEKQEELFASALNTTKLPYQKLLASGFFSDVAGGVRLVTEFISSRLFSNNTKLTLEPKYIELDDLNIIRDNLRDELLGYVPTSTPQTAPAQPVIVYQSVPIQNTIIAERVVETIYRDFHRQTDRNVDLIPQAINKLQYNGEFFDTTLNGAVITLSTTTQATTTDLYAENLTVLGADFTNLSFSQATGTSATTTNFFSSLASSTNLFATTANLGTLTLGALTNGLTISGNDAGITFSGTGNHDITASSGTLRIGSNVIIGSIEALDNTIDIGTPGTRFDKIYANEINATTLVGTLTGGNLTAETFNINSDNATADTEDSYLSFERGTESPNALIKWDSTNKLFDFNNPIKVNGTLLITSSTTLQNFTFVNATGTSATTTNLYSTNISAAKFTVSGDDSELLKIENPSGGPERTLRFMVKNGFSPSLSRNIYWNGSSWVNDGAGTGAAAIFFDSAAGNIELATTDQNSTLPITRLTVKDSGNVGIGTSAPGEKLEVVGNIISKGTLWTSRTSVGGTWYNVAYGNGTFVAVTSNGVMTSYDGINWTSRTPANANDWYGITYGNGLFVAVAQSGTGNRVMTSPDGITWTARTSAADSLWTNVAYGNGTFVAIGFTGEVMTSPDGITWTSRTASDSNVRFGLTYGNGLFVAVAISGSGSDVMTSPDGITWTARTTPTTNSWSSVTYGNGLFVAVAQSGTGNRVMTSPDGITWTARTSAADNDWRSVTYGNGLFVAVSSTGSGNRVMTSPDGITWTTRTSAANNFWRSVVYGNGIFVAVAQDGSPTQVMTSGKSESNLTVTGNIYQGETYFRGLTSFANLLLSGSTTLQNFTFQNATGTSATTTNFYAATNLDAGGMLTFQGDGVVTTETGFSLRRAQSGISGVIQAGGSIFLDFDDDGDGTGAFSIRKQSGTGGTALSIDNALAATFGGNLTTSGTITRLGSAGGNVQLYIGASVPAADNGGTLVFQNTNTVRNWQIDSNTITSSALSFTPSTANGGSTFTTPVMTLLSSGNVGIGTTDPDAIFHVAKSTGAGVGGQIVIDNSASSQLGNTAELSFLTDTGASGAGTRNARILAVNENAGNGAANMQFHTWDGGSSAERMRISSSGNVGIGTTSPSHRLTVRDVASQIAYEDSDSGKKWITGTANNADFFFAEDTAADANMRLFLKAGGNVGIGTSTPDNSLHVVAGPGTNGGITISRNNGTDSPILRFANNVSGIGKTWILQSNQASVGSFRIRNETDGVDVMNFTSAGNVGIGTTTPGARLEVKGTGTGSFMAGAWGGDSSYGALSLNGNLSTGANFYSPYGGTTLFINRMTGGDIRFRENNGTDQMVIQATTGNVGIGTTGPGGKLDVLSTSEQLRLSYSSTKYVSFVVDSNGLLTVGDGNSGSNTFNQFKLQGRVISTDKPLLELAPAIRPTSIIADAYGLKITPTVIDQISGNEATNYYGLHISSPTGGGQIGNTYGAYIQGRSFLASIGTGTGGNYLCIDTTTSEVLRGNGAACTASSERFKEDIQDLDYGLEEVLALRPVSYQYKAETNMGEGVKLGFIAEELGLVLPEVVTYDNNGQTFGLDYPVLTAVLTKAVQELNTKIENVELNFQNASTSLTISTSTPGLVAAVFEAIGATLTNGVTHFVRLAVDFLTVGEAKADRLCLGETCVTETELKQLLQNSGTQSASSPTPTPASAPESEPTSSTTPEQTASTTPQTEPTASSTEPTTPTTEQPVEPVAEPAQATEPAVTEPQPEPVSETTTTTDTITTTP